jgi:hypothetical protein
VQCFVGEITEQMLEDCRPCDAARPALGRNLLLAGIADHLHISSFQVAVLVIVFLHAGVGRRVFGIFFQVVRRRVGHCARHRNLVPDMAAQLNLAVIVNFPSATIVCSQKEFVAAVALGQAARDIPHIGL